MVSDTKIVSGDVHWSEKKIKKIGPLLVGVAGGYRDCELFEKWVAEGLPDKRPKFSGGMEALILSKGGLLFYDTDCYGIRIERGFHAVGSGGHAALGALLAGATAHEAARIACQVDNSSGLPLYVRRVRM